MSMRPLLEPMLLIVTTYSSLHNSKHARFQLKTSKHSESSNPCKGSHRKYTSISYVQTSMLSLYSIISVQYVITRYDPVKGEKPNSSTISKHHRTQITSKIQSTVPCPTACPFEKCHAKFTNDFLSDPGNRKTA